MRSLWHAFEIVWVVISFVLFCAGDSHVLNTMIIAMYSHMQANRREA